MKVMKFGGSSVGTPEMIRKVKEIVSREGDSPIIVVSAFQGITNSLIDAGRLASRGDTAFNDLARKLRERHLEATHALVPNETSDTERLVNEVADSLASILNGVYLLRELSLRTLDLIMSFGERLSSAIVAASFRSDKISSESVDARELVRTDSTFGSARVDFTSTDSFVQKYFEQKRPLPIVTGFIGSTEDGATTTLGRGGSDYTAAILGAALSASVIEIWTDVDGVMTADPRKVRRAFPLPSMTYEEAMELCHFGAKVIYPPTVQPAFAKGIPLAIKNTFRPEAAGTIISTKRGANVHSITGISSIDSVAFLRIQGSGMVGVAGIAMRLFAALARSSVNVILITQASSEHTICVAVAPESAVTAQNAIDAEFQLEIKASLIDPVIVETDLSVISVVGENMSHTPGIAAKMFTALGSNGISAVAIAQGSSELNISAVIAKGEETKALNALHDGFFLSGTKALNVVVVGTGLIGKTLLRQIQVHAPKLLDQHGVDIRVVGIANRSSQNFDSNSIDLSGWETSLRKLGRAASLGSLIKEMRMSNLSRLVLVDCTANDELGTHYAEVLDSHISIVTPNKKPQSGPLAQYQSIKRAAGRPGSAFLFETSVGAGLPVLSTLNDLMKSGDTILRIEAVLSGTLSYLFNSFDGTAPFSELVREARAKGFTEPDPRDDLNGEDVARKLLILAREAGAPFERQGIRIESLVPQECVAAKSPDEFLKALEDFDGHFEKRRQEAVSDNAKLCYVAEFERDIARASLKPISQDHPFYSLSGTDNIVAFTTERYKERPLVVKGPGAGAEVTAAGVFADIVRLSNYFDQ